jgi:hypothetical protein
VLAADRPGIERLKPEDQETSSIPHESGKVRRFVLAQPLLGHCTGPSSANVSSDFVGGV